MDPWTESPPLGESEISALIAPHTADSRVWGEAIFNALAANELRTDRESVCAVIAVIAQESGFEADPVVPGLASLVAARIERYKAKLGPLGDPLFRRLLAGRAPDDARPFEQRLASVRTERDVDVLFRDLLAHYELHHAAIFAAVNWAGKLVDVDNLAELNPITTVGSMQVSVRFAQDWARRRNGKNTVTDASIRDSLYTVRGGVTTGAARLLGYPTHYDQAIFRFADYNAGFYASRNAAVQAQISRLTGVGLALDGDFLSYEKNGDPKDRETESMRAVRLWAQRSFPSLTAGKIRRDLLSEKTLEFEQTETYRAITSAIAKTSGRAAEYAIVPRVSITSPKLSRTRSTEWFAQSVDRRYKACLGGNAGVSSRPGS